MTIDAELIRKLQRQRTRIGEGSAAEAELEPDEVPASPEGSAGPRLSTGSVKELCIAIEGARDQTPKDVEESATTPSSEQDTSASGPSSDVSPNSSCSDPETAEVSGCAPPPTSWEDLSETTPADLIPADLENCMPPSPKKEAPPSCEAPLRPQPVAPVREVSLAAQAQMQLAHRAAASRSASAAARGLSPVDENRVMAWNPKRPTRAAASRGVSASTSPQPFARKGLTNVALTPSLDSIKADLQRRREALQHPSVLQQRRQGWQSPRGVASSSARSPRKVSPSNIAELDSASEALLEESRMCREWGYQCLELASQAEQLQLQVIKKRERATRARQAARHYSPPREWRLPRESPLLHLPGR